MAVILLLRLLVAARVSLIPLMAAVPVIVDPVGGIGVLLLLGVVRLLIWLVSSLQLLVIAAGLLV